MVHRLVVVPSRSMIKRLNWFQSNKFLGKFPCIGFKVEDKLLTLSPMI